MTRLYRLLTEDDSSAFCHKVSQALADGWELHGDPVMSFDAARGVIRCGQAVIKEVGGTYSPDLKLGDQ
jgi:hypothetical protein